MRIIQLARRAERRVGLVAGGAIRLFDGYRSVHSLVTAALNSGIRTRELVKRSVTAERLEYDGIYQGLAEWHILPAADYPEEPAVLSGIHCGWKRGRRG